MELRLIVTENLVIAEVAQPGPRGRAAHDLHHGRPLNLRCCGPLLSSDIRSPPHPSTERPAEDKFAVRFNFTSTLADGQPANAEANYFYHLRDDKVSEFWLLADIELDYDKAGA